MCKHNQLDRTPKGRQLGKHRVGGREGKRVSEQTTKLLLQIDTQYIQICSESTLYTSPDSGLTRLTNKYLNAHLLSIWHRLPQTFLFLLLWIGISVLIACWLPAYPGQPDLVLGFFCWSGPFWACSLNTPPQAQLEVGSSRQHVPVLALDIS